MFIKAILIGFLLAKVLIALFQLISTSLYVHVIQSPINLSSNWVVLLTDLNLSRTDMFLSQVHVVTCKVSIIFRMVWIFGSIMLFGLLHCWCQCCCYLWRVFPVYLQLVIKYFNICYLNWSSHKRYIYTINSPTIEVTLIQKFLDVVNHLLSTNIFLQFLLGSIATMFWRNTLCMTFIPIIAFSLNIWKSVEYLLLSMYEIAKCFSYIIVRKLFFMIFT